MLICKECGTANSFDSSVCTNCGARLRTNRRAGTKKKKYKNNNQPVVREDIFSTSKADTGEINISPAREVFSSEEAYEKIRKGNVLEKIHELEEEIGETSEVDESESEIIVPTVINRKTSNDLIETTEQPAKKKSDKNHDIPYRVIGSQSSSEDQSNVGTDNANNTETRVQSYSDNPNRNRKKRRRGTNKKETSDVNNETKSNDKSETVSTNIDGESADVSAVQSINNSSNASDKSETKNKELVSGTAISVSDISVIKEKEPIAPEKVRENSEVRKKKKPAAPETAQENSEVRKKKKHAAPETVQENSEVRKKKKHAAPETEHENAEMRKKKKHAAPETEHENAEMRKKKKPAVPETVQENSEVRKKKKPAAPETVQENSEVSKKKRSAAPESAIEKNSKSEDQESAKKTGRQFMQFTKDDADKNRYIAALSYMSILILIPYFGKKQSDFCKAHVKQGAAVLVWSSLVCLVTMFIALGLRTLLLWVFGLSVMVYNIALICICFVMLALVFIPVFEGAVGAFSGAYKKVHFVGKYVE